MEQKFSLTEAEYVHQGMYISDRLPANRRGRFILAIFFGLINALMFGGLFNSLPAAVIGAAIGALVGAYARRSSTRSVLARTYKVVHVNELVTVDLTEGGMYLALPHIRSQVDWEAITAIEEDSVGFYFIYGPLSAVFVPRRIFANAGDAQRFWTQAQESWQFARPTPSRETPARV